MSEKPIFQASPRYAPTVQWYLIYRLHREVVPECRWFTNVESRCSDRFFVSSDANKRTNVAPRTSLVYDGPIALEFVPALVNRSVIVSAEPSTVGPGRNQFLEFTGRKMPIVYLPGPRHCAPLPGARREKKVTTVGARRSSLDAWNRSANNGVEQSATVGAEIMFGK